MTPARHCNRRANAYNAGIWPWSTDNTLLQLNEAARTHTTLDGQGFDADYNSRNTLFQYNYSHDHEGGFMLICSPAQRRADDGKYAMEPGWGGPKQLSSKATST
jgi:hypothetical protein